MPSSTIAPLLRTMILSASTIVDKRCAITIQVRLFEILLSADAIKNSDLLSRDEVASSKTKIEGLFKRVRAIVTRCFFPA